MAFNAIKYVSNVLAGAAIRELNDSTHLAAIAGCCGSNAPTSIAPIWNKGINIGLNMVESLHDYDPWSDRSRFDEATAKAKKWPEVEFVYADLTELVGQPLKYEVVIQKEFPPRYPTDYSRPYNGKK